MFKLTDYMLGKRINFKGLNNIMFEVDFHLI